MDVFQNSDDFADFDEAAYLARYKDIADAVAAGDVASGWAHYDAHGRGEGRIGSNFDAAFYLRSYPAALRDVEAGLARDARDHYRRFGKARGYVPVPMAARPDDAASMPRFGGFWVDRPDALDAVEGRLEIGQISAAQAEQLRFWIANGYIILPNAVPAKLADRALKDLDRAYAGGFADLLFECGAKAPGHMSWDASLNALPAKALDLHYFSKPIRELMFVPAITEFLGLIFESRAFASQSLTFLRGSAQDPHQDSAYVAYSVARRFAASWVALEDVTIGAGELFYYEGSHRLADFVYGGRHKSVSEATRLGPADALAREIPGHVQSLRAMAGSGAYKKSVFAAKKGDALIWHADLAHGGNPISRDVTRKSVVTHYCPKRLAPLFAERMQTPLFEYQGHYLTTGVGAYVGR